MAAALVLQRWEDVVLPPGRTGPARAGALVDQDGISNGLLSARPRYAPQVAMSDPRL